ncbi:Uncharacterized protein Adt_48776 [Abeliophyllum distichum]|uniref:Retrotransposon Copia-like N-terminal domain-containing protein n=1 Tax=Abeliophyllum distichum TaxID=126358 RepID=A0ABD1NQ30_9LAMI
MSLERLYKERLISLWIAIKASFLRDELAVVQVVGVLHSGFSLHPVDVGIAEPQPLNGEYQPPSNQSHSSTSNSTIQGPALVNNLDPFGINLTQAASMILDRDNLLLWKNVIMRVIRGHGLEGYLLGTKVCPPQFINSQATTETGTTMEMCPNPEYSRWVSMDQILMGWMYSSMKSKIVIRVMSCNYSSEIWKTINENYEILNRSRVTFLTSEL